jgi:hypothetical protein
MSFYRQLEDSRRVAEACDLSKMQRGNTRSDPEDPERSLLEDVVGEGIADQAGDVAAERRIGVTEKSFQCGPVAGLSEKDQEGLVGRRGLFCFSSGVHA